MFIKKKNEGSLMKIVNLLMLFLTIGSCLFITSVIDHKDFYIKMLEESQKVYTNQVLFFANSILNTPVSILLYMSILATVGKEFYLKSIFTKTKINTIAAVFLLILCALTALSLQYAIPATS